MPQKLIGTLPENEQTGTGNGTGKGIGTGTGTGTAGATGIIGIRQQPPLRHSCPLGHSIAAGPIPQNREATKPVGHIGSGQQRPSVQSEPTGQN